MSRREGNKRQYVVANFQSPRLHIDYVTRRLGALTRDGLRVSGPEGPSQKVPETTLEDGRHLFDQPCEITAVLRRFEELGIADLLLEPRPQRKYQDDNLWVRGAKLLEEQRKEEIGRENRICAAVGAKAASIEIFDDEDDPQTWREFGEREADAWFLTLFAYFYRQQNAPNADINGRLHWAQALGRLLERWCWWRDGYDAEALFGRPFIGQSPDRATRARGAKSVKREHHVVSTARRYLSSEPEFFRHKRSGRINQSKIAERYLCEFPGALKDTQIRTRLRHAIRDKKLA